MLSEYFLIRVPPQNKTVFTELVPSPTLGHPRRLSIDALGGGAGILAARHIQPRHVA